MGTSKHTKRILLVDDEPNLLIALVDSLKKLGDEYVIESANSGEEAVEKTRHTTYDLIITDYMMPGMTGTTLIQQVRQLSPGTQFILMSAYGSEGLQEVVSSLKPNVYIDKPVKLEIMREIVKGIVDQAFEGEDAYRSGERTIEDNDAVADLLEDLRINANAQCVLLLSAGGYPIEISGPTVGLDIDGICTLIAANFMAVAELAKLLGNRSIFKSSYHEGPDYNIYAHDINGDCLLAIIFGLESKSGVVRFYTNKTLPALEELLEPNEWLDTLEHDMSDAIQDSLKDLLG